MDRSSEFVAVKTRAMLESQLGVNMTFILAGKHQQNLVEWAHRILWSTLRAIWIISDITTWKTAVQEAVYQYNVMTNQSIEFSLNLLHHGYQLASPEGAPANPLPNAQEDKIKFTKRMQELQQLIRGIVIKNQEEAHR